MDKNEAILKRIAERVAARRKSAKEKKSLYELRNKAALGNRALEEDAAQVYRGRRDTSAVEKDRETGDLTWRPTAIPAANRGGEFTVGPLAPGEARTYSRAKKAAVKKKKKK
jgi:hypothetical protein